MAASTDAPRSAPRASWPDALLLAAVLGLAVVNLGQPFIWDGAFFTLCAKKLAAGAKLYRDVWDVKQPGLFWFFLAGGRLFGFREIGIRALDVVWMGTLAIALRAGLARWLGRGWLASVAALLSIGYGYAFAEGSHLSQVEWLTGLPLFVALAAAMRARGASRTSLPWALLSGLAGGVALVFKLALLPLVGLLWLVALWPGAEAGDDERARGWPPAFTNAAAVAVGLAAVLAFVVATFVRDGTLAEAKWTYVDYPRSVFSQMRGVRFKTLFDGFLWFAPRWAPVLGLAFLGLARGVRRDRWTIAFTLWLVAAAGVLLVQRFSYWQYHFMMFVVPLGALAARGVDVLRDAFERSGDRRASLRVGVLVALVCGWAVIAGATKALYFVHDGFLRTASAQHRSHLRFSRDGVYGKVLDEVKFLSEPGARPGPIFEIGNPLFTYLAGRDQAGPRNPSMLMDFMQPPEWEACARALVDSRPAYVFIHRDFTLDHPPVFERSASFRRLLDERFEPVRRGPLGTWYAPRGAVAAAGDSSATSAP